MQAEVVADCRNTHGEGVIWNPADGRVWWTDIHGQALWWHDPDSGNSGHHALPDRLCAFAPRAVGGWIMAFATGVALWDAYLRHQVWLCDFEPANPETRLNDGRTDRQGRFIVGGMNEGSGAKDSSVIRIAADGTVETLLTGISCANSTCFSADGRRMFFADTPDRQILSYPYDDAGLGKPTVLADMRSEPGLPDGSCVDAEGGVWNAEWVGGQVIRVAPDGSITYRIPLPVPKATCCAFGGPDLATLFITTSRLLSTPEEVAAAPLSGSLFAIRPGLCGVLDAPFAG